MPINLAEAVKYMTDHGGKNFRIDRSAVPGRDTDGEAGHYEANKHLDLNSDGQITLLEYLEASYRSSHPNEVFPPAGEEAVVKLAEEIDREFNEQIVKVPKLPTLADLKERIAEELRTDRRFSQGLRLGAAYIGPVITGRDPRLLPQYSGDLLSSTGHSIAFTPSRRFSFQADVDAAATYDGDSTDTPVNYSRSEFHLSGNYQSEQFSWFSRLGAQSIALQEPSKDVPSYIALTEESRVNYRPSQTLSFNFDQRLIVGSFDTTPTPDPWTNFSLIWTAFKPGISLSLKPFKVFGGGVIGTTQAGVPMGGYAGVGLARGGHSLDWRVQYVNKFLFADSTGGEWRYAYLRDGSGFGAKFNYLYANLQEQRTTATAEIFGLIKLKLPMVGPCVLRPFIDLAFDKLGSDRAVNLIGGGLFSFGELNPAVPSNLTPYHSQPLPEAVK
jgi:hypothetical protein